MAAGTMEAGWKSTRQSVNGLSLHVVEAGAADDPLLILLHGFPEFWWAWRHQITPFAEADYHVVVPDMRGYNTSDDPQDVSDYVLDTLVADVMARADTFKPGELEQYTYAWGHPGSLTAMLNYYRALRERKKPDQPARIHCPTRIIWGENDSFLEHNVACAALELCDNGQLSIISGATHWLHLEEPDQINAEVIQFLGNEAKSK